LGDSDGSQVGDGNSATVAVTDVIIVVTCNTTIKAAAAAAAIDALRYVAKRCAELITAFGFQMGPLHGAV
jgi:hypothetical protein